MKACHNCDLLMEDAKSPVGKGRGFCPRCSVELYRNDPESQDKALALSCAALILIALVNAFPLVGLDIQGHRIETTLLGTAHQLWLDDMPIVAVLVLVTTLVTPLIELGAIVWLLVPLRLGRRPPGFVLLLRILQLTHPWAMVEVFVMGILVALVKLSHLADVLPGPAIWCFGGLMLVLATLASKFDHHALWDNWERAS